MSGKRPNPSVPISLLTAFLVLFTVTAVQAQFCHDNLWPDYEFCGHDARVVTGEVDMNHDCIADFLDIILFSSEFGMTGPNLSADLNDDGVVDSVDLTFLAMYFVPGNPVAPCNPSPPTPGYCGANLSLSLDPSVIVSRGRFEGPGVVTVYLIASGWSNAGAIEYGLITTGNINFSSETSPVGWSNYLSIASGHFIWNGTDFPVTGTTVVVQHDFILMDAGPASIELVDIGPTTDLLTRWAPPALDEISEFQVRRNVGINTIDPVSTSGCLGPNTSPTLTITEPSSDMFVIFNNFGPEDEYHPDWYSSVSLMDEFGEIYDSDTAMAFVTEGGFFHLDSIELAMDTRGGANELDVWLMEDDGNQPGEIIEEIHLSGAVPPYPGVYPPVVATSQTRPLLSEGVQYWVGVSATGPPNAQMGWHPNVIGLEGLGAQRQRIDGVGGWNVWPGQKCTFRVNCFPNVPQNCVVSGTATDIDGTIDFVEYRVNDGPWLPATGTNSWTASITLVVGENWIQVRTADKQGAYSSTQVVTIVVDPADLAITAWSGPDTLLAGCLPTEVSATVQNVSNGDAPASRLGFYLSTDPVIDASDFLVDSYSVPALPAFNSIVINTTITIPDEGPRGAVFLGAFIDDLDLVDESNENNNTDSSPLEYPIPGLVSVVDVENDQGRVVRLNVLASLRDVAGSSTPILQYEAFRRIDPLPEGTVPGPEPIVEGTRISDPLKLAGWEFVGAVPAHGHSEYNMIVPTLADSTDEYIHYSVFIVRAATVQPLVFFDSCPNSGYSVDNLPPSVPEGLLVAYAAGGNQLSWELCTDDDFRYFRIYRGSTPDFVPDMDNLIEATTDMEWLDSSSDPWNHFYKISAVDRNGNESEIGSPSEVTGVQDGVVPSRTALLNAVPNPFNPTTKLPFEMAAAGHARLKVYDTAGRLVATLVDEQRDAGRHHVIWDGRDNAGRMSSAGVYLYRFEVGEFSEAKRMVLVK